jgi:hypothetical protein
MLKFGSLFFIITLSSLITSAQTKNDSLYVFVGKKIEIKGFKQKLDSNEIPFNASFKAKYQVIQNLYGNYNKDTIEFEAYDHYGIPAFSHYDNVLLFVSNYNGRLIHEKYQYFDVYKTTNGRWASSYNAGDYNHVYNKNTTTVKPELINFTAEVSYKIKSRNKEEIEALFPAPYFKIENDKAIAVWGNYIEQLFELKKTGILKARGFF